MISPVRGLSTVLAVCLLAPRAFAAEFPVIVAAGDQSESCVAYAGGTSLDMFLVAWQDERDPSGTGYDVYAARVSTSGAMLDLGGIPVSAAGGPQKCPRAASGGEGFLVVWQDDRDQNGRWQVRAARVTLEGGTPDGEGVIVGGPSENEPRPDVAWAGSHYIVAWQEDRGATGVDICAVRVSGSADVIDSAPIVVDDAAGNQDSVSLACGAGTTLIAYRHSSGENYIKGATVDSEGVPSPAFTIANALSTQKSPAVAFGGDLFLVAWEDHRDGGSPDIYAARVQPDGTVEEPDASSHIGVAVSYDAIAESPSVAFDGAVFLVAWNDNRNGSDHDIYLARVTPAGEVAQAGGAPLSTAPGHQVRVRLESGPSATLLAWSDQRYAAPMPADARGVGNLQPGGSGRGRHRDARRRGLPRPGGRVALLQMDAALGPGRRSFRAGLRRDRLRRAGGRGPVRPRLLRRGLRRLDLERALRGHGRRDG
jgi:hypothetical protein